jgi:hypothetical protein
MLYLSPGHKCFALGAVAGARLVEPFAGTAFRGARHARAQERGELRQGRLRIAQDRDLGREVLAQLPGIDIQVHDLERARDRLDGGGQG